MAQRAGGTTGGGVTGGGVPAAVPTGGGTGVLLTVTVTALLAVPLVPVQLSV